MTTRIHLSKAESTEIEEQYVLDALRSGWIAPLGPHVDAFEVEIAGRVGVRHALALSSGTAALHLALVELGARPGTVVVLPSLTFAASANAVSYTGATPVFVDSRSSDGNIDPDLLLHALDSLSREGCDIAAVMVVDVFGRCADYDEILPAVNARGLRVVEDAAEALGAEHGRGSAGALGHVGALSFNGNKILTTSGGGMLLSDDEHLINRCRYLSTQARQPVAHYEHTEIGFNYRLSNILAALGRAQLTRLDAMIDRRRAIRQLYVDGLADIAGLRFLGRDGDRTDARDNCWLTTLVLQPELIPLPAHSVIKALASQGIEARPLWKPMHSQPVFTGQRSFTTGVADSLFTNGIALPSGSSLSDDDVSRVIAGIRTTLGSR